MSTSNEQLQKSTNASNPKDPRLNSKRAYQKPNVGLRLFFLTLISLTTVTFAGPATAPSTQSVTAPMAANLEIHEWSVMVIDAATGQINPQGLVNSTLPQFVSDKRFGSSAADTPAPSGNNNGQMVFNGRFWMRMNITPASSTPVVESDEPCPVGVIRLIGSSESKVDVTVNAQGTFLGTWPKAEDRANQLLWRDMTLSQSTSSPVPIVGPTNWFFQLRSAQSAFASIEHGSVDNFLLYDLEMPYSNPFKVKTGKDFSVEFTNNSPATLHDLTFYQGDTTGWRMGLVGDIPTNMPAGAVAASLKAPQIEAGKGRLGVGIIEVAKASEKAKNFGYTDTKGLLVILVQPGSAAEGKLSEGNVILKADGKEVTAPLEFQQQVAAIPAGGSIKLNVFRNNRVEELEIPVAGQPSVDLASPPSTQPVIKLGAATQAAADPFDSTRNSVAESFMAIKNSESKTGQATPFTQQASTQALMPSTSKAEKLGATPATQPAGVIDLNARTVRLAVAPSTQPSDLASAWKPQMTQAGVDPADQVVIARILERYAFDPHRLTAVYRMDDAELNRLLPLEIVPQPAKVKRFALVIVVNVDPNAGTIVDDLIKQLGDEDWAKREAASKALAAMGPATTAKLNVAKNNPDLEISWRAEKLLAQMPGAVK